MSVQSTFEISFVIVTKFAEHVRWIYNWILNIRITKLLSKKHKIVFKFTDLYSKFKAYAYVIEYVDVILR